MYGGRSFFGGEGVWGRVWGLVLQSAVGDMGGSTVKTDSFTRFHSYPPHLQQPQPRPPRPPTPHSAPITCSSRSPAAPAKSTRRSRSRNSPTPREDCLVKGGCWGEGGGVGRGFGLCCFVRELAHARGGLVFGGGLFGEGDGVACGSGLALVLAVAVVVGVGLVWFGLVGRVVFGLG